MGNDARMFGVSSGPAGVTEMAYARLPQAIGGVIIPALAAPGGCMFAVAMTTPSGEPMSWVALAVVLVGVLGLVVGAVLRARRSS